MIRIPALTCEKFGHKQFLLYHRPSAQFTYHGKKSETDLTAGVLKKDQKCTEGCVNKTLFSWTKQNRMQIFRGSSSSSHEHYKNKQTTYLLPLGFFQLPWICARDLDVCTRFSRHGSRAHIQGSRKNL